MAATGGEAASSWREEEEEGSEQRGFGARANLNGGELDKEPSLNSVGQQGDINIKEAGQIKCSVPGPS